MKILNFRVTGLNSRMDFSGSLHGDINVITGLNGAGKTTVLKTMWYLISGNAERIEPEVSFLDLELETDLYKVRLAKQDGVTTWHYEATEDKPQSKRNVASGRSSRGELPTPKDSIERLNRLTTSHKSSSFYFPTFRRIEGGYTVAPEKQRTHRAVRFDPFAAGPRNRIQSELDSLSERISVYDHRFVCSISTADIVNLLTREYAKVSDTVNRQYKEFSLNVIRQIEARSQASPGDTEEAPELLNRIKEEADAINRTRDSLFKPFTTLSELVAKLFQHQGIKVDAVTLGEAVEAIDSDTLSAGEKQMLSFLCYNAFSSNSVVFIDEPELSLHPDWQRRLFQILMDQQPTNQFIIATHSPFIYTRFQDKELLLAEERGN